MIEMKKLGKISIIIPCYNREKTIGRCIDSILSQTLPKCLIEVIAVDDASTDGTLDILHAYEKRFPELILLVCLEKNSGGFVGSVRNIGLSYATGDYVLFMDSDDYIAPNALEKILEKAVVFQADIVDANYGIEKNAAVVNHSAKRERYLVVSSRDERRLLLMLEAIERSVWGKLFRKAFLDEHSIVFPEDIHLGEDSYFHGMSLFYAKKYYIMEDIVYYYVIQDDSIWNSMKAADYMKESYLVIARLWQYCQVHGLAYLQREMEWHAYTTLFNIIDKCEKMGRKDLGENLIKDIKKNIRDTFPELLKNRYIYQDKSDANRELIRLLFEVYS